MISIQRGENSTGAERTKALQDHGASAVGTALAGSVSLRTHNCSAQEKDEDEQEATHGRHG